MADWQPAMVPHRAMTRISISRCFLLRVSRRGSGKVAEVGEDRR